jgi:hypothetical protein
VTDFVRADQCIPDEGKLPPPCSWDYAKRIRPKPPWDKDLALATCRNGHTLRISGNVHSVAPDGTLSPSYVCTYPGCSFHEWVRLVGWDPNHVFEYCSEE